MKKALLGIAGILVMAFVFVLFVNAGKETPADKKAGTEVSSPCMMKCTPAAATTACDPADCMNGDSAKCADCGNADCKGECKKAVAETKSCDPAACPMHQK